MRKTFHHFKQFLHLYHSRKQPVSVDACLFSNTVICLNPQEKDFVNLQTERMIMRKAARQRRLNPAKHWTELLPAMPTYGSAYAMRSGR